MAKKLTYDEQLQDERWKIKRDQIIERDFRMCQHCMSSKNLIVHHRYYEDGLMAWEYPDDALITLCQPCHEAEHERVGRQPKGELLKLGVRLRSAVSALKSFIRTRG